MTDQATADIGVDQIALAQSRASECERCKFSRGVSRERKGWPVYRVKCRRCGCGGLSLIHGKCPINKWPGQSVDQPQPEQVPDDEVVSIPPPTQRQASASRRPTRRGMPSQPRRLILTHYLSPGDVLMLTAAVRDLHKAYPGQFVTDVSSSCPAIWENNPHITRIEHEHRNQGDRTPRPADTDVQVIRCEYPLIHQSNNRPYHFLHGFAQHLEQKLGVTIPLTEFRADIHLSDDEKSWTNQVKDQFDHDGPFWIMMAGGKYDFTTKWWNPASYQAVVDHFRGRIQFVQCGEKDHWHPPLKNVINMIGKTDLRQFIRLMYHAQGVVCPVTLAMHLTAAVPTQENRLRPCVVIAGGRESPHWEAYPGHQFLHTIGMLSCCATGGCWKSRCQPVGNEAANSSMCDQPVQVQPDVRIPRCMTMVTAQQVIAAIERYMAFHGQQRQHWAGLS